VVGAGPTGLTAALEATRMGMSVRIIDHKPERGSPVDSRALVVHPRVMELIKVHGDGAVTDEIKRQSFAIDNLNFTLGSSLKKRQVVPSKC
jgi:2-polyprenyl-6-methoxyphenol hydroxylase-like FAD-dependent oxidoreductase